LICEQAGEDGPPLTRDSLGDAKTMVHARRFLALVVFLCGACTSPTEPGRRPAPIMNEVLVVGIPDNGHWPVFGLYAIDLDSLINRIIAPSMPVSGPALSPDGRSILVAAGLVQEDRGKQLYVMDSDGQNVRRVTGPPTLPLAGLDFWPSWAPNGRLIAFIRDHALVVANTDGSDQRVLVDSISLRGRPSWSPDSRMLLYAGAGIGGLEDLFTIDIQTRFSTNLTNTPHQEMYPDWGPDPDLAAYVEFDTTTFSWQVFRLEISTGARRPLTRVSSYPRFPKWSRSGRQIAFNLTTGPNSTGEIHAVDSAGGAARRLAQDVRVEAPTTWGLETQ
jgi:Tol biopolymer transport system component